MEGDDPAWFASGALFDFNSAYVTVPGLYQMRVQGLVGTNVIYDALYNVGSRTLVQFNYTGINRVNFYPPSDSTVVLDDVTVTRTNYPGPAVEFQKVDVPAIFHVFAPPFSPYHLEWNGGYVLDNLVSTAPTATGALQPVLANFDTNNQFTLTIAAPAGKRFLIHTGDHLANFGGAAIWELAGVNGNNGGPTGSVAITFDGLAGTPPDFSASQSFLTDYHGAFGFSPITSAVFTNDFSFRAITFSAGFSSAYTNSGTLNYVPNGSFSLLTQTSQTNDPGPSVFIVDQPAITLGLQPNGDVILTFAGILQFATSAGGPFKDMPGNPRGTYTIPQADFAAQQYFRTRSN